MTEYLISLTENELNVLRTGLRTVSVEGTIDVLPRMLEAMIQLDNKLATALKSTSVPEPTEALSDHKMGAD